MASTRPLTASTSAGFNGPRFDPPEAVPLLGCGEVAEGRPQKYFGSAKFWPINSEPTGLPSLTIKLPPAAPGKIAFEIPVTATG